MANGHGGSRQGSGRKSTKHEFIDDGLITPLMLLLDEMRDLENPKSMRIDIAVKAAPYCHARIQQTDLNVEGELNIYKVSQLADIPADSDPA